MSYRSAAAALLGVLVWLGGGHPVAAQSQAERAFQAALAAQDDHRLCQLATRAVEQRHGIPRHLLHAISMTETGTWHAPTRSGVAWPWTVTWDGAGEYYPTKAAAIAQVRKLWAAGERVIDVGCVQVNLHFHPDAFPDLETAFDPIANVTYGARFLRALRREMHTWSRAVAAYHSRTPHLGQRYRTKVFDAWNDAKLAESAERRFQAAEKRRIRTALRFYRRALRTWRAELEQERLAADQPVLSSPSATNQS